MECEEAREHLEAWALGILDLDDEAVVDRHVASCQRCREEATALRETVGRIPDALTAAATLTPRAGSKERLLAAVAARRRGEPIAPMDARPAPGPAAPRVPTVSGAPRRRHWWRRPWVYAGAAAGVLLAFSLAWGVQSTVALFRERGLKSDLAALVGQQEIVLDVVDSNRTVKALLKATDPGSTSYGKVYTRPDMPYIVAMTGRLPQPPAGEVYNLWVSSEGRDRLVGKLSVNEQGFGLLVYNASTNGPSFDSATVILQPEASDTASGTPVLLWQKTSSRS